VTIYSWFDNKSEDIVSKLVTYFEKNSCGKCTPCREGTYRLLELSKSEKNYSPEFWDILDLLENASFCAYGRSLVLPLSSYYQNILNIK
jgi:NADH:ubiquinone oxidoreductase subunit F (NADH-binding)